jgi:RHS repeat-associated protein
MQMPGRNASTGDYRYGYQGSEKDGEFNGEGNSYTTEYRQLDPRLGRWLSIDPKANIQPHQSPYSSMDNNPILNNDVLGDIIEVKGRVSGSKVGNWIFRARVNSGMFIAKLVSPHAREMITTLEESTETHTIQRRSPYFDNQGPVTDSQSFGIDDSPLGTSTTIDNSDGSTSTVFGTGKGTGSKIKIGDKRIKLPGRNGRMRKQGFLWGLLHEFFHSYQIDQGEMNRNPNASTNGVNESELQATHNTNVIRARFLKVFRRGHYQDKHRNRVNTNFKTWSYWRNRPKQRLERKSQRQQMKQQASTSS